MINQVILTILQIKKNPAKLVHETSKNANIWKK